MRFFLHAISHMCWVIKPPWGVAITDNVEISSDSDEHNSDEEILKKKNSDEEYSSKEDSNEEHSSEEDSSEENSDERN